MPKHSSSARFLSALVGIAATATAHAGLLDGVVSNLSNGIVDPEVASASGSTLALVHPADTVDLSVVLAAAEQAVGAHLQVTEEQLAGG